MKKIILLLVTLLGGTLFLSAQKFPETCEELADYYGCRVRHPSRNANTWKSYWADMAPEWRSIFAYKTMSCWAQRELCPKAIENLEKIRPEFIRAYNSHPRVNMPLADITNGDFLFEDNLVAAVVTTSGIESEIEMKELLARSSRPAKSEGDSVMGKKAMVSFIEKENLNLVQKLMQELVKNQNSITDDTMLVAYIAYAARLNREGLGPDRFSLPGASRASVQAAKDLVWGDPKRAVGAQKTLEKAGYALPLVLSPGAGGFSGLSLLGKGVSLEITISASEVSALGAAAVEIAVPVGILVLGVDLVYQAIQANHVGRYMQALRAEGNNISELEIKTLDKLLQTMAIEAGAVTVGTPGTFEEELSVGLNNVAKLLAAIEAGVLTDVFSHIRTKTGQRTRQASDTCIYVGGTFDYDWPVRHLMNRRATEKKNIRINRHDPSTVLRLMLLHNMMVQEGICGGKLADIPKEGAFPQTLQGVDELVSQARLFKDCPEGITLRQVAAQAKSPELRGELAAIERAKSELNSFRHYVPGVNVFPRIKYDGCLGGWIPEIEIPMALDVVDIKRIFGLIYRGNVVRVGRLACDAKSWFRLGEDEEREKNIKIDPSRPNTAMSEWALYLFNHGLRMFHIHYEEVMPYPKGEFICNHSVNYAAEAPLEAM